jgi:hypothetical protein
MVVEMSISRFIDDDNEENKWKKVVNGAIDEIEGKRDAKFAEMFAELGMCSSCCYLSAVSTKFGNKQARCSEMGISLKPEDPVEVCTTYSKRSILSIHDMKDMAILIDVKREMGFEKGGE